jgi:sugar lactone lactonase YvrE
VNKLKLAVGMCLLAGAAAGVFQQVLLAQVEDDLTAKKRLFPGIGPGLRAVKRGTDGRIYVLVSPSPGLIVFDATGKQVLAIGASPNAEKGARAAILFGEDCDADAQGRIYVADRAANTVDIFSPEGRLLRSIPANAPVSVAALPQGEVAVATLREPRLVMVYDQNGREVREFAEPERITEREDLNRFLNIGALATDAQGRLYYGFFYMPEPTVRQYDHAGYAGQEFRYLALDAAPEGQAVRREIQRQEKRGKAPSFKRVLTALGVDRPNGEVWMAVHNTLLHFDQDGTRLASYQLYTPQGARLDASTMVVDRDRLIIGSDPLGIYEFERPDKKVVQ